MSMQAAIQFLFIYGALQWEHKGQKRDIALCETHLRPMGWDITCHKGSQCYLPLDTSERTLP